MTTCLPGLLIAGMARSGTSEIRNILHSFTGVDVGIAVELTDAPTEAQARLNYPSCLKADPSIVRVAASPWWFAKPSDLHERVYNRHGTHPTIVLLLRDPVERFISSFFHLPTNEARWDNLRVLGAWANRTVPAQRPSVWAGVYGRSKSPADAWPLLTNGGYYTLSVKAVLDHVLVTVPAPRLLVGLTEEHGAFVARLVRALGLSSHVGRRLVLKSVGSGSNHINSNARPFEDWPGLAPVLGAVQRLAKEQTDVAAIAASLQSTRDFPRDITALRLGCLWHTTTDADSVACREAGVVW